MENTKKTLEEYKRLPYTLRVEPIDESDGSHYWTAEYIELVGCKTDGLTESEAVVNLQELFDDYIAARIETDMAIPEPVSMPLIKSEIWMLVPRSDFQVTSTLPGAVEDTQETKREVPLEPVSANYRQMAEYAY